MLVIERDDYQHMRWKNGAGFTTQIAIHPADSTADNFDWRVSMAAVNADGPFSTFPGIDRTLVVLEGVGIDLCVGGNRARRLTSSSAPFTFAADANTSATLIDGAILDLNIMTRRDRFNHIVEKACESATWAKVSGTVIVFAHGASLQIDNGFHSCRIKAGDTAGFDNGGTDLNIATSGPGNYYVIAMRKL